MANNAAPGWRSYVNAFLAAEISALTRYYDRVIQWLPREDDKGGLLAAIDAPRKETVGKDEPFPDLTHERDKRTAILINGTFNHDFDIQALLTAIESEVGAHIAPGRGSLQSVPALGLLPDESHGNSQGRPAEHVCDARRSRKHREGGGI